MITVEEKAPMKVALKASWKAPMKVGWKVVMMENPTDEQKAEKLAFLLVVQ